MKYTVHVTFADGSNMKWQCEHYDIVEDSKVLFLANPDFTERRYIPLSQLMMFVIIK